MIADYSTYMLSTKHRALGTMIELSVFGVQSDNILDDACWLVDDYENKLTVNRTESEVMDINHAAGIEPAQVSAGTYQLVKEAVEKSQQHFGFNAAIGPLVKLWHIGFADAHVPADEEIQQRLGLIDPTDILFNDREQTVFLPKVGMELDLGGIGKGYIADRLKEHFLANGVASGIINLGGNVVTMGKSPTREDSLWRVGIRNPLVAVDEPVAVVTTKACSAVTSGVAERHLMKDGKDYHHIIDPETGYPHDNEIASITIFSEHSIDGEIETTRLFFADGPMKNWNRHRSDLYGALFAYRDKTLEVVGIPKENVQLLSADYSFR
jgi:thiamine biosynthesis lipoprotein